jgi:hypothetical protein
MFDTLADTIRECHDSAEFTGYSLKRSCILRELEPATIVPIVKYALFPFLISAQEYDKIQGHNNMLEEEPRELLPQSAGVAKQQTEVEHSQNLNM